MIMMTGGETRKPRPVASWGDSRTNHSRWPCALPPISYRFRFNGSNAGVRNATMWKWSAHGSSKPAGCQLKQRTSIEFAFVSLSRARRGCLLLLLRFPRRQIWCWAEIKQAEREEKKRKIWVERLFFCICLYMYIISLSPPVSSMRMHLFKSIHAHTQIYMIIRCTHSMCQNYHIYFAGSQAVAVLRFFDPVQFIVSSHLLIQPLAKLEWWRRSHFISTP